MQRIPHKLELITRWKHEILIYPGTATKIKDYLINYSLKILKYQLPNYLAAQYQYLPNTFFFIHQLVGRFRP